MTDGAVPRLGAAHSWLLANALTFGAYFVSGAVSVFWLHQLTSYSAATASTALAIPWLAPGFAAAGLYYFGTRAWPAVFLGSLAVWAGVQGSPFALTLVESLGEALSIVVSVRLLDRWGFRPTLERYIDSLYLLAALAVGRLITAGIDVASVLLAASFTPAYLSEAGLRAAGVVRSGETLTITFGIVRFGARWWANTFAGGVLVMPLLALLAPAQRPRARLEPLALWLLVALWLGAAVLLPPDSLRTLLLIAALLLVVWAAERFGAGVAGAVTLVLVMSASAGFGLQVGAFAGGASRERLEATWGFLGLLSTTSLFVSALLSQRWRARRDVAASARRYRRLFDGNPFPMWAEDPATGRISLANPAALAAYGYSEAEFLALDAATLRDAESLPASARLLESGAQVSTERHRTRGGDAFDVEVTRALIGSGATALRACFVEPLAERNAMRLAILNANDLERFRLGQTIRAELMPHLASVAIAAENIVERLHHSVQPHARTLATLRGHVDTLRTIFRRLTRGASPLADADGDLIEALERLPSTLPAGAPPLSVEVRGAIPASVPVERREHIYRLAEDAVHAAVAADVAAVRLVLESGKNGLSLTVQTEGTGRRPAVDERTRHSMTVRALAAHGQLSVGRGAAIRFDCDLGPLPAPPEPLWVSAGERPQPAPRGAAPAISSAWDSLGKTALVALAYFGTGALSLEFLWKVDALGRAAQLAHWLPWIASGVAVAGILSFGERVWPAIAIGYVALWSGFVHGPWAHSLVGAGVRTVALLLAVRWMRRFGGAQAFESLREILLLAGAAALALALVVPFDVADLMLTDPRSVSAATPEIAFAMAPSAVRLLNIDAPKIYAALRWWLNSVVGIVLFVPAAAAWSRAQLDEMRRRAAEFGAWAGFLALLALAILAVRDPAWRLIILGLSLTSVTWAAVRFGAAPAYLATLLYSLVATVGFGLGLGALASPVMGEGAGVLWGFILLLATAAHLLTTLLAESDRTAREVERLDAQYRALFEAVPHALLAYQAGSGRIRLANREALERLGYSAGELARLTLADLDVEAGLAPAGGAARRTTRFRARDGATLDVELALTPLELEDGAGGLCFAIDVSERNTLYARMIEATDGERRNLVRELHDELGQVLTGLHLGAASLTDAERRSRLVEVDSAEFVATAARQALQSAEHVLQGVSPLQESGGDLLEALRNLPDRLPPESRGRLEVTVSATSAVRLSLALREHLYRIAQEAVTNALKHAAAHRIGVAVTVTGAEIELAVDDDGVGFDPEYRSGGLGLDSLNLRAAALHGSVRITAIPGHGTTLRCRCPQTITAEA